MYIFLIACLFFFFQIEVGLNRRSNPYADTGKFKEIYRQQTHTPIAARPSSEGVKTRRMRLLNQTTPQKETSPTKIFEVPSQIPEKYPGKDITYAAIANYKKHNKVNFKYAVLRNTDLPLDPGDVISSRDIGYAGVLDKTYLNVSDTIEEQASPDDVSEKVKKEVKITKVPPKPVNQITSHRKEINKLKNKNKTSTEKSEADQEAASNKSLGYAKTQNTTQTQNKNVQKQLTTANASGVVQEIYSIPEISMPNTINTETNTNYENTTKKQSNFENTVNYENIQSSKKNSNTISGNKINLKNKDEKVKNTTKDEENNLKISVVEKPSDTDSKNNKEYTCTMTAGRAPRNNKVVKTKYSPKINLPVQKNTIKRQNSTKKNNLSNKLRVESINFISIIKKEKNAISKKNNLEQSTSKLLSEKIERNETGNEKPSAEVNCDSALSLVIPRNSGKKFNTSVGKQIAPEEQIKKKIE